MASSILGNVSEKVKNMAGEQNKKIAQLSANTKDVHDDSHRITSDYGVKQNDTDHWLAATSEDKQGPQLLEDPFGREKVRSAFFL
jgi:catalase